MSFESHGLAVNIEHRIRRVFNCDRFGFGGIADADYIESPGGMYTAMACALAAVYSNVSDTRRNEISDFIQNIWDYSEARIEEIITQNGRESIDRTIAEFERLISI